MKQNNINSLEEKEVLDTVYKHLKIVGIREINGKSYETYICEGNLVEDIQALLTTHEQQARREGIEKIIKLVANVRRFDAEEKGVDYFAGWDNCLDTIQADVREFLEENPSA